MKNLFILFCQNFYRALMTEQGIVQLYHLFNIVEITLYYKDDGIFQ